MNKISLVLKSSLSVWLGLLVVTAGRPPIASAGTFGQRILLPGHISEIILDEPRSVIYAADFTAGQVDVISTTSNRLVSSFNIGGPGSLLAPSGLAMSPDGQYLVVTNYKNLGVSTGSSVTVINLTDLSRQDFSILNPPLAVAFGSDGVALITTTADIQRFRPNAGTFEVVSTVANLPATAPQPLPLPVDEPKFPQQITKASMATSGDGNYIFGLTDAFMFVYGSGPSPTLYARPTVTPFLFHPLTNYVISAAFDGSHFMAGQYLMDRKLRVMAEFPNVNPGDVTATNQPVFGGHAIDFGIKTVYAYFPQPISTSTVTTNTIITTVVNPDGTTTTTTAPGGTTSVDVRDLPPSLLMMDSDNLNIRDTLQLPERITGRMLLGGTGRYAYAISESGLMFLPLSDMATLPQIRPSAQQMFFQFDFCQQAPLSQQLQINGRGDFKISSTVNGVTVTPSSGTAPATVTVTVDVAGSFNLAKTQGTTHGQLQFFSASAVNEVGLAPKTATGQLPGNLIGAIQIDINVKDADQRGTLMPIPGKLVDVVADPLRDQFYAIEQTHHQVMAFSNSDLRLLGTFRTGNTPNWMGFTPDGRYLLVANMSGENVTVIDLNTMQSLGYMFTPWSHYPMSVASDNGSTLIASRIPVPCGSEGSGVIDIAQVPNLVQTLYTLGVYENCIDTNSAIVPLANAGGVLFAEAAGKVKLWDANLKKVVLTRQPFASLSGAIAAGPDSVVVQNHVLNMALVPTGDYVDAPNVAAGFNFTPSGAIRTAAPSGVTDTGTIQRANTAVPGTHFSPVRLVETPSTPTPVTFTFLRSLAGLRNGNIVSIATTGLVQLPGAFDAGIAVPQVSAITSAADYSNALAPGGLVTIFGQNLASDTASAGSIPLTTELANMCVTMNGVRLPLLYTSATQINAQVPFEVSGQASTVLHTAGGMSSTYYAQVQPTAPAVFQLKLNGLTGTVPAIVRTHNNELATLSNPLHKGDIILVYATGIGAVGPSVADGSAGSSSPLSYAATGAEVTLGGVAAPVYFTGLAPGFVGVYQMNIGVPGNVPQGMQIPLTIKVGSATTTVEVRVVD